MSRATVILACLTAAGLPLGLAVAQDSPQKQFTARELYYAVAEAPSNPAKPPAPKSSPKAVQAKATPTPTTPAATTPVEAAANRTAVTPPAAPRPSESAELPGGAHIVNASTAPAPTAGPALGLKYTILKQVGSDYVEVASDTVFHAGDHIRFKVESNSPGYLYIVSLGSSGTWRPMFPASEVDDGSNHVDGFHSYTMPPKSRLTFVEPAGAENLFIVLSREPEPGLESVIYSLKDGGTKPGSEPSQNPPPRPSRQTLVATASIDNSTIGRLRQTYARDLIIETINDEAPGDRKEKAVYVVNPTGSKDSRVVADLSLIHK